MRRPRSAGRNPAIPCVVGDGVPLGEVCAFLDQALEAASFERGDRWWRVEVGEVVVINEPEGRVWVMREQSAAELNVYFDLPDDFLGHCPPQRILRSWRRSLGEAIPEGGARGQELMQGVTRCAELLAAIGVAAGLPQRRCVVWIVVRPNQGGALRSGFEAISHTPSRKAQGVP